MKLKSIHSIGLHLIKVMMSFLGRMKISLWWFGDTKLETRVLTNFLRPYLPVWLQKKTSQLLYKFTEKSKSSESQRKKVFRKVKVFRKSQSLQKKTSQLLYKFTEKSKSLNSLQPDGLYSLLGSSIHRIFQARILGIQGIAISFSRWSSRPRDWTQVSRIAGRLFTDWATRESPKI